MLKFIIIGLLLLVIELYSYQAIKQLTKHKGIKFLYVFLTVLLLIYIGYGFSTFDTHSPTNHKSMWAAAMILLFYLPKIIVTLFLILEDVVRIFRGIYQLIKREGAASEDGKFLPGRRSFITKIALGIAAIPFVSVLHGITIGRYKFQVYKLILEFDDLPEAFDGFKFTQVSDIHCGSFDNREKIEYAVALINAQESDLLLFTGDIVNSIADEMTPWFDVFDKLRPHEYGNFSILGNHDYGDYAKWDTEDERRANFQAICDISPKIGFELLRNENTKIYKDGQSITIVGVENWGAELKFMKYGDLDKATAGVDAAEFKILMSHDPSHWDAQILDHPKNFQLTLAGHTHGSQFGIEIPGFIKWSPIQYVYKQWAGLYEKMNKYIYVNRGFGYHAYPGRTGIWPEITVIELRRKK